MKGNKPLQWTLLIAALVLVVLFLAEVGESAKKSVKKHKKPKPECHLSELDETIVNMFYFTHRPNTTGIAADENEWLLMCYAFNQTFEDIREFMGRCATGMQQDLFSLVADHFEGSFGKMCKPGPLYDNYVKFSPCIHAAVKLDPNYKSTCVNDLQASFEWAERYKTGDESANSLCCAYNRWEDCIVDSSVKGCGEEGGQAIVNLIKYASGGLVHAACKRDVFNPATDFCRGFLPPAGTAAKGRKGSNTLSRVFSMICPTTGY